MLHDKSVVGRAAWNRLFDETTAGQRFLFEDKKLTIDATLNLLTDRDGTKRKIAAQSLSAAELLRRLDEAQMALKTAESVAWTRAYLDAGYDRAPLVRTLALAAVKEGNDPHNQEIGLCLLEDYGHTSAVDRDTLLLACAHHTAGHVKFGDPLESYRRFSEALGV